MYVLAPNQIVKVYPYSIADLRRDNPNTSFPSVIDDAVLESWGVYPVTQKPAPEYDPATQNCNQVHPTLIDEQWVMTWTVTPATPEEITQRTEQKSAQVRQQRNDLLSACDWTQLDDSPLNPEAKSSWAFYRENLRMVPEQPGFPWNVQWPPQPGAN